MEHFDYIQSQIMMMNNNIQNPNHLSINGSKQRKLDSISKIAENANLQFGTFPKSDDLKLISTGIDSYHNIYTSGSNPELGYSNDSIGSAILNEMIPALDNSTLPSMYVEKEISQPSLSSGSNPRSLLEGMSNYDGYREESKERENSFENDQTIYEFAKEVFEPEGIYDGNFEDASTVWGIQNNKLNCDTDVKVPKNYHYNQKQYMNQIKMTNSKTNSIESLATNEYNEKQVEFSPVPKLKQGLFSTEDYKIKRDRKSTNMIPKFIVDKFRLTFANDRIKLSIKESSIQCLSITIDYNGYAGRLIGAPVMNNNLTNEAINPNAKQSTEVKLIELIKTNSLIIQPPPMSTLWQRVKYPRDVSELDGTITNIVYKKSSIYDFNNPYEPQYYRFELDDHGDLVNESKCGMCAYCEKVKFLPFKNSSYLSHLTLEHGIFSNNYLTPEGVCYGRYLITKNSHIYDSDTTPNSESPEDSNGNIIKRRTLHKPRVTEALACPACFEIIEVGCWKMKSNPLLSYFRHFKKHHKNLTNQRANFQTNPLLTISKRGRKLQILES